MVRAILLSRGWPTTILDQREAIEVARSSRVITCTANNEALLGLRAAEHHRAGLWSLLTDVVPQLVADKRRDVAHKHAGLRLDHPAREFTPQARTGPLQKENHQGPAHLRQALPVAPTD